MSDTLHGKTALVTGASRGIGSAIARRLAADGAEVFIHYARAQAEAIAVVEQITADGGRARAIAADLATSDGVDALIREVGVALGDRPLDILINNAAVVEYVAGADTDAGVIDRQYAVNVRAPFLLAVGLAPRMPAGGSIVFTSSIVAKTYFPGITAYAVTKGAVDTLVLALAGEFGPRGLRVNAVAPGAIATDMSPWLASDDGKATAFAMQALQRIGQPDDIARVAAFLAGPDSGWVTGQIIDASGGSKL